MRRLTAVMALAGLLAGCNTGRDPDLEGQALAWADQAVAERWRYARFVTRCDGDTLAECRLAPPWRSRRLFSSSGTLPEPDSGGPTYWVHAWANEQTPDDAARAIMNAGNALPIRPPRVQPTADLDALRGAASQAWKAPAGAVSGRIAGEAVRVAVLDTVPHGVTRIAADEGVSPHGLDMARAVQQGACGSSVSCPVTVVNELALDLVPGRVGGSRLGDPALGGAYGDPGSVAVAIHKATERWLADDDSSRLVLLIPAGWAAMADDPGAEAVALALDQARCFGAAVVAAYGNAGDGAADAGRVPRGPLCPACFADQAVAGCAASTGPVWPAAGVQALPDGGVGRLPNGRDPGEIAPAVYGYGAHVRPSGGALAWTGSSAGAALAAAGLAVTWAGLPDATGVAGADAALAAAEAIAGESGGFLAPCKAAGQDCTVGALGSATVPASPCEGALCYEAEAAGAAGLARDVGVAARPVCDVCVLSGETLVLAAQALPGEEPDEFVRAAALKVVRADGKVDRFALDVADVERAALARSPLEVTLPGILDAGAVRSVELVGLVEWDDPDREVATRRVRSVREAVSVAP